jgi:hypothetical protein
MPSSHGFRQAAERVTPAFPDPQWFIALGRLMEAKGDRFLRLGFAEVRFCVRLLDDAGGQAEPITGIELEGYRISRALPVEDITQFDPDFTIAGPRAVWQRLLAEIARDGHPELRRTLNSLVLIGDELWLESSDQLREDKFYRFNQTLQELFNLASHLPSSP